MNFSQMLLAVAVLFGSGVSSASTLSYWNIFGRADGTRVSATEARGPINFVLTTPLPNGSTTLYGGSFKAVYSDDTTHPATAEYTITTDGGYGWIKAIGYFSEPSDADACIWAARADLVTTGGRISFAGAQQAPYQVAPETVLVLRGTIDKCTGTEEWNIVGDSQLVLIVP